MAMRLFNAKDALVNAQLEEISDKLQENKDALKSGTAKLEQALDGLEKVKAVIDAATSLLSIVAKVVTFAAVPWAIPAASLLREEAAFGPEMSLRKESKAI